MNQDYRRPTGYPLGDGLLSKITALAIIIAHRYFIKRIIQNSLIIYFVRTLC